MAEDASKLSPRQKMINLMYIVLTAMLALNVSSDVLDGFVQVHQGLERSNENVYIRNSYIYAQLEALAKKDPELFQQWLDRAKEVRSQTDNLLVFIDSLSRAIVIQADGPNGDPNNIYNRDDLDAAAIVMLSPSNPLGEKLRVRVDSYRDSMLTNIFEQAKADLLRQALSTQPIQRTGQNTPVPWEVGKFENQPVVAAVTLLSKLKSDILYAEGETLNSLMSQTKQDFSPDVPMPEAPPPQAAPQPVNPKRNDYTFDAFVIPNSRLVMRGGKYEAQIVLASIDGTQKPDIYVGGTRLADGKYVAGANSAGTYTYSGHINLTQADGTVSRFPFSSTYTVIEPMATISPTMMNVLYAGIDNPISISVPGIPMSAISASMTNGTLTRTGDRWIARPQGVGKEAVITVTATVDGHTSTVATMAFRIRKLPDPVAYIPTGDSEYKGGRPLPKASLLGANGVAAHIDDGIIDAKFTVTSFQTVFIDQNGDALPENSAGSQFSQRQKDKMREVKAGRRFYITNIKATGPDNISRDLAPIEVIVR